MKLLEDYISLLKIKRYSYSTINSYKSALLKYFEFYKNSNPGELSKADIEFFINYQVTNYEISQSYQKQMVGALKLLYNELLLRNYDLFYLYPDGRVYKLPEILSKNEVKALIDSLPNIKHKAIISTLYSAGLRLEEVLNLKPDDIDSEQMLLRIKTAKGNKERNVVLSFNLLLLLREYYKLFKPVAVAAISTIIIEMGCRRQYPQEMRNFLPEYHKTLNGKGIFHRIWWKNVKKRNRKKREKT
jgi:integrase/recombinase XerD